MKPIGDNLCNNFRITILDFPGFGESDEPKEKWNIEKYSLLLEKFTKELNIKKPIVMGHSFGGRVGIHYSSKNPIEKLVLFGSPCIRIKETLSDILKYFGDRKIVVAKELTKIHENFYRGKVSEIKEIFANIKDVKGEFIILIEGIKIEKENELNQLPLEEHYDYYAKQGLEKKDIIKKIAKDRGVNKNEIYQQFIDN